MGACAPHRAQQEPPESARPRGTSPRALWGWGEREERARGRRLETACRREGTGRRGAQGSHKPRLRFQVKTSPPPLRPRRPPRLAVPAPKAKKKEREEKIAKAGTAPIYLGNPRPWPPPPPDSWTRFSGACKSCGSGGRVSEPFAGRPVVLGLPRLPPRNRAIGGPRVSKGAPVRRALSAPGALRTGGRVQPPPGFPRSRSRLRGSCGQGRGVGTRGPGSSGTRRSPPPPHPHAVPTQ